MAELSDFTGPIRLATCPFTPNLLEEMFLLSFEFAVPDLLFARELAGGLGDRLIQLGLRIEELTSVELRRTTVVNRQHTQLSVPDTFAFAIAESRGLGAADRRWYATCACRSRAGRYARRPLAIRPIRGRQSCWL